VEEDEEEEEEEEEEIRTKEQIGDATVTSNGSSSEKMDETINQ